MANRVVDWREIAPAECQGGAVTIGNFDGAHRGHAALVAELHARAGAVSGPAVVVTFAPHPREVLHPGTTIPLLTTLENRADLLHTLGAEEVLFLRTNPELLGLGAAEFFAAVIQGRLRAKHLVEGPNFKFGHNREGNIDTLARLCQGAGVGLTTVPPVLVDGEAVSSSRIRRCLEAGDVARARELLGRCYRIRGTVVVGQRRGRTIGFPTANLVGVATVVPGEGVYAVRAVTSNGAVWPGAANLGPNPTFGEAVRKIEAHLIGFTGDLYGQLLAVEFVARLRDVRPFGSAAALAEQLQRDVEQARGLVP
jgi:riboflavin kinase/FMN adenylyltransferase